MLIFGWGTNYKKSLSDFIYTNLKIKLSLIYGTIFILIRYMSQT